MSESQNSNLLIKIFLKNTAFLFSFLIFVNGLISAAEVEQYTIFGLEFKGPSGGNPFKEVQLSAEFSNMNRPLSVERFYDGSGI